MATRRQKVEAGLFLLIGAALLFGVLFLLIGLSLVDEHDTYYVHFYESVGNLKKNSPVSFKGYPVGRVAETNLAEEMTHVIVTLCIEKGTRITSDVRAELKFSPLSQVYFIELTRDGNEGDLLEPGRKIEPKPSNLDEIVNRIPELQASLADLLQQITALFSNENIASFGNILDNLDSVVVSVPDKLTHLETEVVDLKKEIKESMDRLVGRIEGTLTLIDGAVVQVETSAAQVEKVGIEAENLVAGSSPAVDSVLAEIEKAVRESRALALDLRGFVGELEEEPSRLIWSDREKIENFLSTMEKTVRDARSLLRELRRDPSRVIWSEKTPARKTPD